MLLGLGSILGTGVFVSLAIAAGIAGAAVVPALVVAAAVATANGLSSAQLAAAHPVSGGTYEYAHRLVHPVAGFLAGWLFLAAKCASGATAALGCAGYLLHLVAPTDNPVARIALALVVVGALTWLVASGIKRSNTFNAVIVSLSITALACFVIAGLASADAENALDRFGGWPEAALSSPGDFLHAVALLFVAYTGYGRIATLGEEVVEPERTIPRAIVATFVVVMLLYVAVAITAVAAVGAEAFGASVSGAAAPLEVVARRLGHPWLATLVALAAVTAMAGVVLNLLLGTSRVMLAMARRAEMPASLAHVDAKSSSPARAVWVCGGVTALLVLLGDVAITWSFSAFTVLVYYGLTNLAALELPREARRFPRWVAWAGLVSCAGLAFFVPWPVWLAGCGLLVVGLVVRYAASSSSGS